MSHPFVYEIPLPATVPIGLTEIRLTQHTEKGFDFLAGAGKAWTGTLQGSVARVNWTDIDTLATSAQGSIAAHYNWVRLNVTVAGALGTGTRLVIAGKVH